MNGEVTASMGVGDAQKSSQTRVELNKLNDNIGHLNQKVEMLAKKVSPLLNMSEMTEKTSDEAKKESVCNLAGEIREKAEFIGVATNKLHEIIQRIEL